MHSFVYQKDQNKIIIAQTTLSKPTTSNVNPFYEFISNMKTFNLTQTIQTHSNYGSVLSIPTQPTVSSERKNSSETTDPRKAFAINRVNPTNSTSQKPQIPQTPKTHQPHYPREKRSRSRDKNISHTRQNSQTGSVKQKNPEFYRKTRLCLLYEKGQCPKNSSYCNFAHGYQQLRCYKTQLCYAFEKGQCKKPTEQCKYAHGKKQLRSVKDDNEPPKNTYENRDKNHFSQERHLRHYKDKGNEPNHYHDRKDRDRKHGPRADQPPKNYKTQKYELGQDPLSYKKNLPLSKEYEKFLYGDSKVNPVDSNFISNNEDSLYMIPSVHVNTPKTAYSMEAYSIDLNKNFESYPRSSVHLGYSEIQRPYTNLLKQKEALRQPPVHFYEKPALDLHRQNYPYLNQTKPFSQKKYDSETSYPEMSHHGYIKADYINPYHSPSSNFGQDFLKYPYKNSNQGSFNEQPFNNGVSKIDNYADSVYRRPSGYPQVGQPVRPEDVYRNESFYYGGQNRKAEFDGLAVGGNNNVSGYRKEFSGNGGCNGYPAMDKNVGQGGKGVSGYPARSYDDKGTYSGFSKKGYQ